MIWEPFVQWPKQNAISTVIYPITFSQYIWSFVVGIEGKSNEYSTTSEISSVTLETAYIWNRSQGNNYKMPTWMLIIGI